MASGGGPKPRKKSAATRAWRSLSKGVRKTYKKRGKALGYSHRETVQAHGSATRKARIKRGTNPNTGTGSYAHHAIGRAVKKGKITKSQARHAKRVSTTFAHQFLRAGTKGTANYGQNIASYAAHNIPKPARTAPSNSATAVAHSSKPRSNYKSKVDKVAAKVTARAAASGKYAAPRSQKSARAQARKIIKGRK